MTLRLIGFCILMLSLLSCENADVKEEDNIGKVYPYKRIDLTDAPLNVSESLNQFSYMFANKMLMAPANSLISPLSLYIALSMVLNGASGENFDQLSTFMKLENERDATDLNITLKKITDSLQTNDNHPFKLQLANGIWSNQIPLQADYKKALIENFQASITAMNFANPNSVKVINDWTNQKTNGLIPKLLEELTADKAAIIANAIYMKGLWKIPFQKGSTDMQNFCNGTECSLVSTMNVRDHFFYNEEDDYQAIRLDYKDTSVSMYIILPKVQTLVELISEQNVFSNEFFNHLDNRPIIMDGSVSLPKFKFQNNYDTLHETLKEIGLNLNLTYDKIFDSNQQFFIEQIMQKTYIEVDEEGTKAAAVTAIGVATCSAPIETFIMKINKPFLFLIRDQEYGIILFAGTVYNPNQN